jgi:hypothetical protein
MLVKAEENSKQIESLETVINLMIKKINFTHDLLDEMELEKPSLKRYEPTISSTSFD